jgi:hypothetical protein
VSTEHREADRALVLAVHFGDGDAKATAAARAHVEECGPCREYLHLLSDVDAALREWPDEEPPAGLADRVLARATRAPQPAPARVAPSAMPLVGLVPVLAFLVLSIRQLAGWLDALPYWRVLEPWPAVHLAAPFAAAAALLFALGGLASLAAAPALLMESRR